MSAMQLLRVSVHQRISVAVEDVLVQLEKGPEAAELAVLRALLTERLSAAAEEIAGLFEKAVAEYENREQRPERETCRQEMLLNFALESEVRLHRPGGSPLTVMCLHAEDSEFARMRMSAPQTRLFLKNWSFFFFFKTSMPHF